MHNQFDDQQTKVSRHSVVAMGRIVSVSVDAMVCEQTLGCELQSLPVLLVIDAQWDLYVVPPSWSRSGPDLKRLGEIGEDSSVSDQGVSQADNVPNQRDHRIQMPESAQARPHGGFDRSGGY